MRLRIFLVASLLWVSACGAPVGVDEQEPELTTPEEGADVQAFWVSCPESEGTACTTPGSRFRCYNQYPNEPGICFCTSTLTYSCS
ncbi:hypothetical protein ACN469_17030 [Corallococcus terminator]